MSTKEVKEIKDMNVLIIDDEEKICELLTVFIESVFDFRSVVSAPNAVQGMQKFLNQDFDLLIVDMVLPGRAGLEMIQQLRNSVKYSKMKIILISGYLQQENVLQAIQLGVKHIVVKPFTRQQIINQVADALNLDIQA